MTVVIGKRTAPIDCGRAISFVRRVVSRVVLAALIGAVAPSVAKATGDRFELSPDGTEVLDTLTNLVWKRCSEGQTFDGSTCAGPLGLYSFDAAVLRATAQSGWRLPNVKELFSIIGFPAMDPVAFPGTPTDVASKYWTSTPMTRDNRFVWTVRTGAGGAVLGGSRCSQNTSSCSAEGARLRLVRER